MTAQRQYQTISPEQYLAVEDEAETKSEYYDGVIVAMPPFSAAHCAIAANLIGEIGAQIRHSECAGYGSQLRILAEVCNCVLYPDLTVVCGTPKFAATRYATLLNPTLVVEVVAKSTGAENRGRKFQYYRAISSLRVYVLVSQDKPLVDIYARQTEDFWEHEAFSGVEAIAPLPAIGATLRLSEVYDRISFSPALKGDVNDAIAS